jgi:hypothetical protein
MRHKRRESSLRGTLQGLIVYMCGITIIAVVVAVGMASSR